MKKLLLSFITIAAIATLPACKKSSNSAPVTTAGVMFVNGCAGTTGIDAVVGTTKVSNATSLAFQKNTGYLQVAGGTDSISFLLSNLGTPLIKNGAVALTANSNYSIYAGGLITSPLFITLTDDLSAPGSGNAKIRFVNLSTDALNETASAGLTTFATGITSGNASVFSQVTAGTYTIKAGDPSNISSVVSTSGSVTLASGRIYTVILTGTLTGSGTSGLTLTVINNN